MTQKVLIVFYSLTGNTRLVAEAIRDATGGDLLELKPVKDLKPGKFSTFMWGGAQSKMRKKPDLEPYSVDLDQYDLVFLGSPVWAWTLSPPLRSFLDQNPLVDRKVALWMCAAGNGLKAMKRFEKALDGPKIVHTAIYKEPLKNDPEGTPGKVQAWAKECLTKL